MDDSKCCCDCPGPCSKYGVLTSPENWIVCKQQHIPPRGPLVCVYLGAETDEKRRRVDQAIYQCGQYDSCTLKSNRGGLPACDGCKQFSAIHAAHEKYLDPLRITDRAGNPTHALRNMLYGGAAFLVCGGPSLKTLPYERLRERGVFSLGINNAAGFAPCSAFVCSDPPSKFHSSIFLDPKVMKFLPTPKLRRNRNKLRKKVGDKFEEIKRTTANCPNVWGFERRSWLMCNHTWFTEPSAAWGNHQIGVNKTGEPKTVNTMLLGLRVLQYLGAKIIFLLGVDFHMDPSRGDTGNYAFPEHKHAKGCLSNNDQYVNTANWLSRLKPVFEQFGFQTFNCNPLSSLRVFDHVPFETALEACRGPVCTEPLDLERWYEK